MIGTSQLQLKPGLWGHRNGLNMCVGKRGHVFFFIREEALKPLGQSDGLSTPLFSEVQASDLVWSWSPWK